MSQSNNNLTGWLEEKMVSSLTEIAEAARRAKALQRLKLGSHLASDQRDQYEPALDAIISELYAALYNLTKIASTLNDTDKWSPDDRDQIYDNERQGLADVLTKYGLSGWLGFVGLGDVDPQNKVNVSHVLQRIRQLAQGPVGESRTLIYVELRKIARDPWARQILDLMEPVTQGEKDWTEFQKEISELLKPV